jgi:hypothetical protein
LHNAKGRHFCQGDTGRRNLKGVNNFNYLKRLRPR